jgi:hypothetical protein
MRIDSESSTPAPEDMRAAMAAYVRATHQAYLQASESLAPADRSRLPLYSIPEFTVAAVGAQNLHIIGTTEKLPAPRGHEVVVDDSVGQLRWKLRFFDPTVIPELGLTQQLDSPETARIQDALGIRSTVYHLSIPPGGGLSEHHAHHAGTGLAHSHAAAIRDFEIILALSPHRSELVLEMNSAFINGLPNAHTLLAREILPQLEIDSQDFTVVRKALIKALRGN